MNQIPRHAPRNGFFISPVVLISQYSGLTPNLSRHSQRDAEEWHTVVGGRGPARLTVKTVADPHSSLIGRVPLDMGGGPRNAPRIPTRARSASTGDNRAAALPPLPMPNSFPPLAFCILPIRAFSWEVIVGIGIVLGYRGLLYFGAMITPGVGLSGHLMCSCPSGSWIGPMRSAMAS